LEFLHQSFEQSGIGRGRGRVSCVVVGLEEDGLTAESTGLQQIESFASADNPVFTSDQNNPTDS
jgi:hypothetical protein